MSGRRNREAEVVNEFRKVAGRLGLETLTGQGSDNRIEFENGTYFQFGDLRVPAGHRHVVVEVETAGGLTNLVKYWYCLENNLFKGPMVLIHLYSQNSINDLASHVRLWHFFRDVMERRFGKRFQAHLMRYPYNNPSDVGEAVALFESILKADVSDASG